MKPEIVRFLAVNPMTGAAKTYTRKPPAKFGIVLYRLRIRIPEKWGQVLGDITLNLPEPPEDAVLVEEASS